MIDVVPEMIVELLNKLPALAIRFINAVIGAVPKLISSAINFLVSDAPKIIMALMKTLHVELPKAILNALISALKAAGGALSNLFKGGLPKVKLDTKQIMAGVKALGRTLSGAASKIFAVTDLGEGSKATDKAKALAEGIENGMKKAGNWLKDLWDKIFKGLKAVWMWIYEKILKPIIDAIKAVWAFVYDTIIKPLLDGLKAVWAFVYNTVIKPFLDVLKAVWTAVIGYLVAAWNGLIGVLKAVWEAVTNNLKAVWEGVVSIFQNVWKSIQSIWDTMMSLFSGKISFMEAVGRIWETVLETARVAWEAVSKVFGSMFEGAAKVFDKIVQAFAGVFNSLGDGATKVGEAIWAAIKKGFEGAGEVFKKIGTGIWDALKDGLSGVQDIFKNAISGLNPSNLFEKMFKIDYPGTHMSNPGTVEKTIGIDVPFARFAGGGVVPGQAMVPGNSKLNDRIVAMLSPGEAVIPRDKMQNPAIRNLVDMIMAGSLSPAGYAYGIKDLKKDAGKVTGAAKDVLGDLDPRKVWERIRREAFDVVMRSFEANKFHGGGLVPGFAFGGDVPAMLQPGEFVMNRGAVSSLGTPFMRSVNGGGSSGSQGATNIEMNFDIKTTEPIDEAFFRNRLMPKVKDELRRASLDGAFIISGSGVRKT
jgi:hypothetical protein